MSQGTVLAQLLSPCILLRPPHPIPRLYRRSCPPRSPAFCWFLHCYGYAGVPTLADRKLGRLLTRSMTLARASFCFSAWNCSCCSANAPEAASRVLIKTRFTTDKVSIYCVPPFMYAYKLEVGVAEREMAGRRLDRVKPFSDEQCCRLKAHNILNCKVWWNCGTNVRPICILLLLLLLFLLLLLLLPLRTFWLQVPWSSCLFST